MHWNPPKPPPKKSLWRSLSLLGVRAGIAGRLAGGLARAAVDPDRGRELWHRLQDYERFDGFRSGTAKPHKALAAPATGDVPFPILVTTNSGLYLLEPGGWHRLLDVVCFGIARHENTLFVGASAGLHSFVMAAEIVGQTTIDALADVRVLARYETRYHNERIHQITYDPGRNLVWGANCRRNSLIAVDLSGRGVVDEKFLMVDPSGSPFITDQNHVNAVAVNGDTLLFGARYAGTGGGLGFVSDNVVRVYQYPAVGIHDVVIHDDGIMFTDSFCERSPGPNPRVIGAVRYRGKEYFSDTYDSGSRNIMLRGVAVQKGTLAAGFSAFALRREDREDVDGGGVILFRDGKPHLTIEGPFGQVHDVLPFDGVRTDAPGPVRSTAELDALFRRDVGPLISETPLVLNPKIGPLR
jgi:hypothetical protein